MPELTLEILSDAVAGNAAAFRSRSRLQPAGGAGTKVFPPTYAGAVYAVEKRRVPDRGEPVTCVLLDSVQSQANRMEEALQDALDEGRVNVPLIVVDFSNYFPGEDQPEEMRLIDPIDRVTSLQAPHRLADAILRDSLHGDTPFRKSEVGREIDRASARNATPLYRLCPTALIFGMWDSTGPKGGLGAKFERAIVSEIVGVDASFGVKTGSRIDPLRIGTNAGPIYKAKDGDGIEWTTDRDAAEEDKKGNPVLFNRGGAAGKPGNPSKANHGNITPSFHKYGKGAEGPDVMSPPDVDLSYRLAADGRALQQTSRLHTNWPEARQDRIAPGGVTIDYAEQTTVLSLPALRRLRFPENGGAASTPEQHQRDAAARTVLAALALCSAELAAEKGMDLRSRCLLWPEAPREWELLDAPGATPERFTLGAERAVALLSEAVEHAKRLGVEWNTDPVTLRPSDSLVKLVRKSQDQVVKEAVVEESA